MDVPADYYPDSVPQGLNARQYFELGLRYRLGGHVERAKESLRRTIILEPATAWANKAAMVLKTQLPREPVTEEAEQQNIKGYNLMHSQPEAAKPIFADLMNRHPNFEWPFSNLAVIYLSEGNIDKAAGLAKYLISVNPENLRSIGIMLQIALRQHNWQDALQHVNRYFEVGGDDPEQKQIAMALKQELLGQPPDTVPDELTAQEYFELAERYDFNNRYDCARESIRRCLEKAEDGSAVQAAGRRFKRERVPLEPVGSISEAKLKEAVDSYRDDKDKCVALAEQLVSENPNEVLITFLSGLYLSLGELKKAERLAASAHKRNPEYVPAGIALVQLARLQSDLEKALVLVDRLIPDDGTNGISLDLMKAQCQMAIRQRD